MDYMKLRRQWIEDNPIRKFRKENKYPINAIASLLNVGGYSVQRWESGDVKPNNENMEKISKLINDDAEKLWDEWTKEKPTL